MFFQTWSNCHSLHCLLRIYILHSWLCEWKPVWTERWYKCRTFYVIYFLNFFRLSTKSVGACDFTGKHWIKSMLLTASFFPFMCFGIGFVLNIVAISYRSLAAIPFGTMVYLSYFALCFWQKLICIKAVKKNHFMLINDVVGCLCLCYRWWFLSYGLSYLFL